jgi:hypothetical protein
MPEFSVPAGWQRGAKLSVQKRDVHFELAWWVELPFEYRNYQETNINRDMVAGIWFHEDEKFMRFMNWWFS